MGQEARTPGHLIERRIDLDSICKRFRRKSLCKEQKRRETTVARRFHFYVSHGSIASVFKDTAKCSYAPNERPPIS